MNQANPVFLSGENCMGIFSKPIEYCNRWNARVQLEVIGLAGLLSKGFDYRGLF